MTQRANDPSLSRLGPPHCFTGPKAKTAYGTVVEVRGEKGCGLLHVRKAGDKSGAMYVCHITSLTGVTEQDREILAGMSQGHKAAA